MEALSSTSHLFIVLTVTKETTRIKHEEIDQSCLQHPQWHVELYCEQSLEHLNPENPVSETSEVFTQLYLNWICDRLSPASTSDSNIISWSLVGELRSNPDLIHVTKWIETERVRRHEISRRGKWWKRRTDLWGWSWLHVFSSSPSLSTLIPPDLNNQSDSHCSEHAFVFPSAGKLARPQTASRVTWSCLGCPGTQHI